MLAIQLTVVRACVVPHSQEAELGGRAQRGRKCAHLLHQATSSATDHDSQPITPSRHLKSTLSPQRAIGGLQLQWINPFSLLPPGLKSRLVRRMPIKRYRKYIFT